MNSIQHSEDLHVYVPDPFPPENPQNARTGNQTVSTDGTVNVMILWDASRESDLVVHHYKVTWSTQGTPSSSQSRAGRVTDGVNTVHAFLTLLKCEPVGGCGKFITEELIHKVESKCSERQEISPSCLGWFQPCIGPRKC